MLGLERAKTSCPLPFYALEERQVDWFAGAGAMIGRSDSVRGSHLMIEQ